jgi:23S rRNA (adenine2503-C2)-methyltransferase
LLKITIFFKIFLGFFMKNLFFDLSFQQLVDWLTLKGSPSFIAKQIFDWIYKKGVISPEGFTNLSLSLRDELLSSFSFELPKIEARLVSKDASQKILLKTHDELLFEMVIMPYDKRVTLCISSQVGCRMGCTFCQTGRMGLSRNLTQGEILSQLILANQLLEDGGRVSNVVFMGMGEPLDNFDPVVGSCQMMCDKRSFGLSKERVTVSTSGLIPEIKRLGDVFPVRLAISLHNADDEKRSRLMPVNRRYPLKELKEALLHYPASKRVGITFEYVMIKGVNDDLTDAKKLVSFLHGLKAKVNLIPINHFPGVEMHPSEEARLKAFQGYLAVRNIPAPIRYSRGQDVSGGCGQLAAKKQDELDKDPRVLRRERKSLIQIGVAVS